MLNIDNIVKMFELQSLFNLIPSLETFYQGNISGNGFFLIKFWVDIFPIPEIKELYYHVADNQNTFRTKATNY